MINILFFVVVGLITIAGLSQWRRLLVRLSDRQPIFEWRPVPQSPIGMLDLVAFFLIWSCLQLLAIGLLQFNLGISVNKIEALETHQALWLIGTMASVQLIAIGISLGLFWLRYRDWNLVGLGFSYWRLDCIWGIRFFVMVVPLILLIQWALSYLREYQHDVFSMFDEGLNVGALAVAWFAAVMVAPITEEVFFRGYLQNWLQRVFDKRNNSATSVLMGGWFEMDRPSTETAPFKGAADVVMDPFLEKSASDSEPINPYQTPLLSKHNMIFHATDSEVPPLSMWAIGITSVLFGLVHYGQGLAPIPLFFFSIALGILYRRTGSLIPCLVLHAALNSFSMFWFSVALVGGTPLE